MIGSGVIPYKWTFQKIGEFIHVMLYIIFYEYPKERIYQRFKNALKNIVAVLRGDRPEQIMGKNYFKYDME